jgi:hypothetical protein
MHRRALLRTFLSSVFAAAMVAAAGAAEGVKLARTPKKGEKVTYHYELKGDVAMVPFTATGRLKREVTAVMDSGDFATTEIDEDTKVIVMAMELPPPKSVPTVMTRARGNRLVDYQRAEQAGITTLEVQRLLASLSEPLVADKTVSTGESWETELDNPVVAGKSFKVKSTFVGTEKLGETEAWKITQSTATELPGGPFSHEATYWLDPANGQVVKQEATTKGVPSNVGTASWIESQERVKP